MDILQQFGSGQPLTIAQAKTLFQKMTDGEGLGDVHISFILGALANKETAEILTGAALALREKAVTFHAPPGTLDTCGTGGDGLATFNISTAVAFVVAGCGVPVAKHGNRAVSSKASGSVDALHALGINVDNLKGRGEATLRQTHLAFLFAPHHHPAMARVAPVRQELGIRTIFNLLGPLLNPANADYQLLGVYAHKWTRPMAETLHHLGIKAAWVVHGSDGLDELTTTGPSHVAELRNGHIREFTITPEDAGLPRAHPEALKGGTAEENAAALRALLNGEPGAYRDIVLLNAAAALVVAGKAAHLRDGVALAAQSIDDGRARHALEQLVTLSNA